MTSVKDYLEKTNAVRRLQGSAISQDCSHFHSELTICSDRLCGGSCNSLSSSGLVSVTVWTLSLTSLLVIATWSIFFTCRRRGDGSENKHWELLKSRTSTTPNVPEMLNLSRARLQVNSSDFSGTFEIEALELEAMQAQADENVVHFVQNGHFTEEFI